MATILAAVLAFLVAIFFHSIVAVLFPLINRVKLFAVVGLVMALVLGSSLGGEGFAAVLPALLLYAFLCELYVFAITLALGSISANLLMLLSRGEASVVGIKSQYSGASMTSLRLERLCRSGYLAESNEGWTLTVRGKALAARFARFRQFLGHDESAEGKG